MENTVIATRDRLAQDRQISGIVEREHARLLNFIHTRVADAGDAEDILQDVFYELVAAYRLLKPVEQAGAWLFRVARNRITDRFRKKTPELLGDHIVGGEDDPPSLEDLLPSPDAGPAAVYARSLLIQELEDALAELPDEQRSVFIAHELEGVSFKQLAAETGLSVNTLLSRKRYAVLRLRQRLQAVYEEIKRT